MKKFPHSSLKNKFDEVNLQIVFYTVCNSQKSQGFLTIDLEQKVKQPKHFTHTNIKTLLIKSHGN